MFASHQTEASVIAEVTRRTAQPIPLTLGSEKDGLRVLAVPETVKMLSLEDLEASPRRAGAAISLARPLDMPTYIRQHRPGNARSAIFANRTNRSFTAFLSYHQPDSLSWLDHTITVQLAESKEYKRWKDAAQKWTNQEAFADFIEDNLSDIIPLGADSPNMHDVALNFTATLTKNFVSTRRVDNGDHEFTFKTETSGDKKIKVPAEFEIAVPIFDLDPDRVRITVKLRHRVSEKDGLQFFMKLQDMDRVVDGEWSAKVDTLRTLCVDSDIDVYEGTPPAKPKPLALA